MICKDARRPAHQADADQFEPQPFDHRGDDVGQAAVDGGFGDQIGHAVLQKQKSGPSGPP